MPLYEQELHKQSKGEIVTIKEKITSSQIDSLKKKLEKELKELSIPIQISQELSDAFPKKLIETINNALLNAILAKEYNTSQEYIKLLESLYKLILKLSEYMKSMLDLSSCTTLDMLSKENLKDFIKKRFL